MTSEWRNIICMQTQMETNFLIIIFCRHRYLLFPGVQRSERFTHFQNNSQKLSRIRVWPNYIAMFYQIFICFCFNEAKCLCLNEWFKDKGLAKPQRNVLSNIYLFLLQRSKTPLPESMFLVVGWCWMWNIQFVCHANKHKFLLFLFNKCSKTLRHSSARPQSLFA